MEYNKPILIKDLGVLYPTPTSTRKQGYGIYKCFCGREFKSRKSSIKTLHTKSCGCLSILIHREKATKHGLSEHRLYKTWDRMKDRCYNAKSKAYKDYGGRGIKVCDRWLDVRNFIEDMYPSFQEGLTLDRVNVNGDYTPDNCRWVDASTQMQNTRSIRRNNTSGFRGVRYYKPQNNWVATIRVNNKRVHLGYYLTAIEAAKAYERYVRLNKLEHNFTPALTEEEIKELVIKGYNTIYPTSTQTYEISHKKFTP